MCNGVSIVASGYTQPEGDQAKNLLVLALLWPLDTPPDRGPDGLAKQVKQDYDEARKVLVFSPTAAATMSRRCMQHVIRTKMSIQNKKLWDEIALAVESDQLSRKTREALDHIREIGNYGAHPDVDQANQLVTVTEAEARYTLFVLELLFEDLYHQADRIESMKVSLAAKKQST